MAENYAEENDWDFSKVCSMAERLGIDVKKVNIMKQKAYDTMWE